MNFTHEEILKAISPLLEEFFDDFIVVGVRLDDTEQVACCEKGENPDVRRIAAGICSGTIRLDRS